MAVTNTYGFSGLDTPVRVNLASQGDQFFSGAVTTNAGNAAVFYYSATNSSLMARLIGPTGNPAGPEIQVATGTMTGSTQDLLDGAASVTKLSNGNLVVTWADSASTRVSHYRIYDQNLNPVTGVLNQPAGLNSLSVIHPDVTALADGGFAIAFERVFTPGTDNDIWVQRYNANGTENGGSISVNTSPALDEFPSIAGLADGGFAIAHDRRDPATGNTTAWRAVYNANGTIRLTDTQFDVAGARNNQMDVVALSAAQGGGFVINYTDNGWVTQNITNWRFNAAGATGSFVEASTVTTGTGEEFPASAISSDGYIVLTYNTGSTRDMFGTLISPTGTRLAFDQALANSAAVEFWGSVTWLDSSRIYATWTTGLGAIGNDGNHAGIAGQVFEVTHTSTGDAADDVVTGDNLKDIMLGNGGNDTLSGLGGNDILNGGIGTDVLNGGEGNDVLIGGAALAGQTNTVNGGNGSDTASYQDFLTGQNVYADLRSNLGVVNGVTVDTLQFVENLTGGFGDDALFGNAGDNVLNGREGNDQLYGNEGDDTLIGGTANFGAYNILNGGTGTDTADYSAAGHVYVILASGSYDIAGGTYTLRDTLTSVENAIGGVGNDTILGTEGIDNRLVGGSGNDFLYGFSGNDTLLGGTATSGGGYNYLSGGVGQDMVSYEGTSQIVYADATVGVGLIYSGSAYVLTDIYESLENLTGGVAGDTLVGTTGINVIEGGAGGDVMFANVGNTTDSQIDVFAYRRNTDSLINNYDQIFNFKSGQDKLDFRGMGLDASKFFINVAGGVTTVFVNGDANPDYDMAIILQTAGSTATLGDLLF